MDNFLYIFIGFLSGILSSMGFGGGTVLVLLLTSFMGVSQIKAQGINLLYFIPVAAASLIFHFKNNAVDKAVASQLIAWGIIGSFFGALTANFLEGKISLKFIFALFVLALGLKEIFSKKNEKEKEK
ncbi:MAG: sulfite exporter TauE/SafE family protein [Ruminococcaceae bacterium]|nr:sulfite exporter TauE/SafE family protein [Oscillospiraceae bacterium]